MHNNANLKSISVISKCMVSQKELSMEIKERGFASLFTKCNAKPPYRLDMPSSHEHTTHRMNHMVESRVEMCDM
jgi:hypothetical protein